MIKARTANDRGSVSVFIIGCFVLALLLVATATDLAVLQLNRRTLQAAADTAALAAAQAPDLTSIYANGLTTYVPIDAALARQRALTLLHAHAPAVPGLTVDTLAITFYKEICARYTDVPANIAPTNVDQTESSHFPKAEQTDPRKR